MITNLRDLVKEVVNREVQTGESFSIRDITGFVRSILNPAHGFNLIEVPELRVTGEAYEFEVNHADVKTEFLSLLANDEFSAPLNRQFNGNYFIYEGATVPVAAPVDGTVTPTAIPTTVSPTLLALGTKLLATQAVKLPLGVVYSRVNAYLANCAGRGVTPTTKQVQSAIKRGNEQVGWTCAALEPIIKACNAVANNARAFSVTTTSLNQQ